jgi:hypothetical protein
MGWVLEQWGARALVEAGGSTKDHLRTAIQLLSPTIPTRYIYSHLGWRKVNGQAVYLSMEGAVGRDGVEVRLIPDLARWEDWTVIDRLVELFKTSNEESSWVRVPVINYLRACPNPEAAAKIDELAKKKPLQNIRLR